VIFKAFKLVTDAIGLEFREVLLQHQRQPETVVHVGSLLETTGALEPIRGVIVRRSGDPSDVMVGVEDYSFLTVLSTDQLQTVIVNKDCGGATLASVGLHGLFNGVNQWGTVLTISRGLN